MKIFGTLLAAAATLAVSTAASSAAITITATTADTLPAGQNLVVTFDAANAAGYSWTYVPAGSWQASGSVANLYREPTDDSTTYGYIVGGEHATLTTPTLNSLSFYIGSLDSYNTVSFLYNGAVVASYTGSQLSAATGIPADGASSGRFTFNFGSTQVNGVEFSSSVNSLEFDNIAVSAAPEASVWLMLLAGFGLTGLFLRNAKRQAGALAA